MKPKVLCAAVLAAMALLVFASTASATTLSVGGTKQNAEVAIEATIASGGSWLLTDTAGFAIDTCTTSTVKWHTSSPFTEKGTGAIGGPITTLEWTGCTEGNPTTDAAGTLSVTWIKGTTNGTVSSTGAKVTVPSFYGTLTCTTSGTDIGTLTGVAAGSGILRMNAVLSCTVISTAKWSGTYVVTTAGLGVEE